MKNPENTKPMKTNWRVGRQNRRVSVRKAVIGRFVLAYVAMATLFLSTEAQARADQFTFTYSDPYGDIAQGTLTAAPSGLADGSWWATSGTLTITANPQFLPPGNVSSIFPANHYVGTYNLLTIGPFWTLVFANQMSADNLIYPSQDAYSSVQGSLTQVPGSSYLDSGGLLFGSSQIGIDIYAVGYGVYGFQIVNTAVNGVHQNTDLAAWAPEEGTFQLTAVPEPASVMLLASGFLAFGGLGLDRRFRR